MTRASKTQVWEASQKVALVQPPLDGWQWERKQNQENVFAHLDACLQWRPGGCWLPGREPLTVFCFLQNLHFLAFQKTKARP